MKEIQSVRNLGELITDSIKIIFRNLGSLTPILLLTVMLPAFVMSFILLVNPFIEMTLGELPSIGLFIGFGLSLMFILLHVNLVSISLLRAGEDEDPSNVSSKRIMHYVKKLYWKNLIVSIFFILYVLVMFGSFILLMMGQMFGLAMLMIILLGFIGVLYFSPLFFYAQRYYLSKDNMSLWQSFSEARNDLLENYGISLACLIVNSLVSSFLRNLVLIPFMLLTFAVTLGMDFDFANQKYTLVLNAIQSLFLAFGTSYLYLYFYVSMFLKSYDLEERKTGEMTIKAIELIGSEKETFFENEGEY